MEKLTCKCQECHQVVTINILKYGGGYVGVCNLCNGVAYNEYSEIHLKNKKDEKLKECQKS